MKKFTAILLAAVMLLGSTSAYAATNEYSNNDMPFKSIQTIYGNYSTYYNSYYLPDFASVTGISGTKLYSTTGQVQYSYSYKNVDSISLFKYINVLRSVGYVIYNTYEQKTASGTTVTIQGYLPGKDENDEISSFLLTYSLNFPSTVVMRVIN